jgi:hypothetical protein
VNRAKEVEEAFDQAVAIVTKHQAMFPEGAHAPLIIDLIDRILIGPFPFSNMTATGVTGIFGAGSEEGHGSGCK